MNKIRIDSSLAIFSSNLAFPGFVRPRSREYEARGACTRVARIYARPRGQLQKFALNHEMDSDWKRQIHSPGV